jgi:hypothetical protein
MFILILLLLAAGRIFAAQDVWTGVERVVAVGDIHGDYEALVAVLRSAGLIDQRGRWTGGKAHLVQTGDVLDRGPDSRKAMDLLIALEKQAAKAGGRVHSLIGNHEAMNLYGDLRYTSAGEFSAFRTNDSVRVRDAFWEEYVKELTSKPGEQDKKKWEAEHPLGWFEHRYQFGPQGLYGKWIRSHNTVVKINDSIYLHGGISPKYATMTIGEINQAIAAELNDVLNIKDGSIVTAEDGPLWYRGLAQDGGAAIAEHVDKVLQAYGVKRIVIGHTPTAGTVIPRFDGKVVIIDVGLSAYYGSRRACLVLERDKLYTVHRGQKINLPEGASDYLRYLKQAAALEPAPSPLGDLVREFEAGGAKTR